jgi:hypothetical protein
MPKELRPPTAEARSVWCARQQGSLVNRFSSLVRSLLLPLLLLAFLGGLALLFLVILQGLDLLPVPLLDLRPLRRLVHLLALLLVLRLQCRPLLGVTRVDFRSFLRVTRRKIRCGLWHGRTTDRPIAAGRA